MHILLALVIGFVVGLIVISMGGGGAAIYLGVLTSIFGVAARVAATTSLITALPALCIGAFSYWQAGKIDFKLGRRMLVVAIPAVIIGSLVAPHIPKNIYTWIIGGILAILGLQILWQCLPRKQSAQTKNQPSWLYILFGILSGLMVGIGGLSGGGPIVAGLLIMGVDTIAASATSSFILVGMSLVGIVFHLVGGTVDWAAGLPLMIGAIIGAFLAPQLMAHSNQKKLGGILKPLQGAVLLLMGILTII